MALLQLHDAESIASRSRPWTLRLEYSGTTASGGSSNKFWYATGRGFNEAIEIGWGRIGAAPQHQVIDWPEFRVRLKEKLSKGYVYADGPYIRMTQQGIAKASGTSVPVTPKPAPATFPSVATTTAAGVSTQASVPPTLTKAPSASLLALGEPYSLIRGLMIVRNGTKIEGYNALDDQGQTLFTLDAADGRDFATEHDLEIVFV